MIDEFPSAEPREPATPRDLERIQATLQLALPTELRSLLLESDGLLDEYGTEVVWSAERIISDNVTFRSDEQYRSLYDPRSLCSQCPRQ
ncbi:SMI1/KNR4 family protein [Streptomyces sp. BB1-1-1]|uniref:SMI1/KNR4 family protein n=1 Tax=Streptomyces sp. BB1-1-1 TaxID=3074430 RepID=UPI002877CA2E|nr:SMI1/KNR4 family protein [Streptomyces sp. BB1-1-1]WND35732.1 SMI1/KNR4 family protein [Streptomyces sp. BB1-1-1]